MFLEKDEPVQGYASVLQVLRTDARYGKKKQRTEAELRWLFPSLSRNDITDGISEFQLQQQHRPIQALRPKGKRGDRRDKVSY